MARKVVFQADTGGFTAPVERSATVVRDLAKALKEQEQAAKQAYRDQIANAKAAGASVEELQQIEANRYRSLLALQAVQKQIATENVSNGKAAVNTAEARVEAENLVTAAYQKQLLAVNETFGAIKRQHAEVAGSIAGGAAIRTVDGGQNVRAVENFLAKTLGLGPLLQNLFPLVGGIAFIQILSEAGSKIYELYKGAKEAGEAMRLATEEAHAKTQVTIDDLDVQAAKLQLNIDKLSGKPNNGLALALAEAKKMADQLQTSLAGDRKELEALLKEHSVGVFASALSGVSATGQQEKEINQDQKSLNSQIADISGSFRDKLAGASSIQEVEEIGKQRDAAIRKAIQKSIDMYKTEIQRLSGEESKSQREAAINRESAALTGDAPGGRVVDNSAKIANLKAVVQRQEDFLATQAAQARVADLMQQDNALKGGKDASGRSTKAAEEQRKQWELQLKELQKNGDATIAQEREFWLARLQVVQLGSDNYLLAYGKFLEATKKQAEQHRKLIDDLRKANDESAKQQTESLLKVLTPGALAQSRGNVNASDSGRRLSNSETRAGYSAVESDIQYQRQTKQITELDAAMRLQALHAEEYRQALAQLQEQLAAVRDDDPDAAAKRNGFRTQIVDLNSRRASQVNQDRLSTWDGSTSGAVGARGALDDFVRSTRDAASQMRTITDSILHGINDQLSSAIVGENTNWSGTFRGIGKQVANFGLEQFEGSVLDALGFGGKPDGSSSKPFYVKNVDGLSGGGLSGLSSLFSGGDSGGDSGSGAGSIIGTLLGMVPGFADGGTISPGTLAMVGERGPELVRFGTTAQVTPNGKLSSIGGDTHHYSIDARGSTDPAATEKAVRRAIAAARPGFVADAVNAVNDRQKRLPSNARR